MFDIGWGELLVIGVVALLVVGPKELPALLRTIGRYVGMIKRQANEFRAQFDAAMREAELEQLRKEVAALKNEAESSLRGAEQSVRSELQKTKTELDSAVAGPEAPSSAVQPQAASSTPASVNGSGQGNGFNGSAVDQPRVAETSQSAKSESVSGG
jgi:sec-independent protein translocase protein TatB